MYAITPVSKIGKIIPAQGLGFHEHGRTASSAALPVAGDGYAADSLTAQQSDLDNGVYLFDTSECMGLELHFSAVGLAGVTATARVFRELVTSTSDNTVSSSTSFTYRHLCDISLAASSAQAGTGSGSSSVPGANDKWCVPTITSDAGLSPSGTRVLQGTTAGAAGSVVIDPLGASRVLVVLAVGSADYVGVHANKWTGM